MKRSNLALYAVLIVLGFGLALSCNEDSKDDKPPTGQECALDEECPSATQCEAEGTCQMCESCENYKDCADGYVCTERKCCKKVGCQGDDRCEAPQYCLDFVCRDKACTGDEQCTLSNQICHQGYCIEGQCTEHEQCDTKLCNLQTKQCERCIYDEDCPAPESGTVTCEQGYCTYHAASDGDQEQVEKAGCEEYKLSCLYTQLNCFNKIYPIGQYKPAECTKKVDGEGKLIAYIFSFSGDASRWEQYGDPSAGDGYFQAYGTSGFCYRMEFDTLAGALLYYNKDKSTQWGTYSLDIENSMLTIKCPEKSPEVYDINQLRLDCPGYQEIGFYSPPVGSLEKCKEVGPTE